MAISAHQVKALRDDTGAGMMDCKKALQETGGDIAAAKEWLQKKGIAAAQKRAGRTASEGVIGSFQTGDLRAGLLIEVNCETDFVARNDDFRSFVQALGTIAVGSQATTATMLLEMDWDGQPVTKRVLEQSGKTGENLVVRRLEWIRVPQGADGQVGSYIHDGKIGVVVAVTANAADTGSEALAEMVKDVAMHVAAMDPTVVSADRLDPALVRKQHEIFAAQAADTGKPPEIAEKIVLGRVNKWKKEVSLLDQPFVKDTDLTVAKYLAKAAQERLSGAVTVSAFARFALGEGVEG